MAEHTRDQSTENAEETLPTIEEMSGLIKTFSPPPDAEHTPGPWYASSYDGWDCIRDAHDQIIAKLALNVPDNACLIAAAPELLAALELAANELNAIRARDGAPQHIEWDRGRPLQTSACTEQWWDELTDRCFAAIAKARGEADPKSEDEG